MNHIHPYLRKLTLIRTDFEIRQRAAQSSIAVRVNSSNGIPTKALVWSRITPAKSARHELTRLYALGQSFSATEENARCPLPELGKLPSERQFQAMVSEYQHLLSSDLSLGGDRWRATSTESQAIVQLHLSIESEFTNDLRSQSWRPYAIVAGIHGGAKRKSGRNWLRRFMPQPKPTQSTHWCCTTMHSSHNGACGSPTQSRHLRTYPTSGSALAISHLSRVLQIVLSWLRNLPASLLLN